MNNRLFYIGAATNTLDYARKRLESRGCKIVPTPTADVTHLLLPVPSFDSNGNLRSGGDPNAILGTLPKSITVIGGNLRHEALQDYRTMDLLQDECYLAQNARITAECAIQIAMKQLPVTLAFTEVLIIGWGRIAKCLAQLLQGMGAEVTVTARKEYDLAMASALGYSSFPLCGIEPRLARYRVIFNTVPATILPEPMTENCRPDCVMIDLASVPGIGGSRAIQARGLPGKMTPETSGNLIANSILRNCAKKEALL